ncbi:MAG: phosphotransferase [Solirubrobacteraceae bacterium]
MAQLTVILERLSEQLGPLHSGPVALDGGITNRNFRVRLGEHDCVVRLPGKHTELLGIDRGAERTASREAARLGIAPAVLAADEDCLVTEWVPGAPIENRRLRAHPESAARALRVFHESGVQLPTEFWVPDLLARYAEIVSGHGRDLPADYEPTQELVGRIAEVLPLERPVACHDDLLPGNILATDAEPDDAVLVDWEYAGMGHPMFDLGNLVINNQFDVSDQDRLLAAYYGEPPTAGRRAALNLFKLVSDAREAAWGVVQQSISELEFDFAAYAREHFERLRAGAADPRLQEWLDGATA